MIHSADPDSRSAAAVRDGHSAPVTCATCGCRLQEAGDAYVHFNPVSYTHLTLPTNREV